MALSEFFHLADGLLSQYQEAAGTRVARLAAVVSRMCIIEEPGLALSRHFCQEKWWAAPLNRPENFELHAHKVFQLAGWIQVNSWVRNKTGALTSNAGPARPIVLVEQDVNTLLEEQKERQFTAAEMTRFFQDVTPELDRILYLYFPDEEA